MQIITNCIIDIWAVPKSYVFFEAGFVPGTFEFPTYIQKNVWANQPNFGWSNHRIYGQPNFLLTEQNFLVNKICLIIPIIFVDPTKYYA